MSSYKAFNSLFCNVKDRFDQENYFVCWKYLDGVVTVKVYCMKGSLEVGISDTLDVLNYLQVKYNFVGWSPFYFSYQIEKNKCDSYYCFCSKIQNKKQPFEKLRNIVVWKREMSYDLNACHEVANEYSHRANMENRSFTHNVGKIEDKTYKIKQLYLTK